MKIFVRKGFLDWVVLVVSFFAMSIPIILFADFFVGPALNYLLYGTRFELPALSRIIGSVWLGVQLGF